MIKTNIKDMLANYIGYFFKLFANIIVLPIILANLTKSEYGVWTIFMAVGSFILLLDLGFGTVIVRYITYAYCGAEKIIDKGYPNINNKKGPNWQLFFTIFFSAKRIYSKITIMAGIGVLVGATYIYFITEGQLNSTEVIVAWFFYSMGILLTIYFMYYTCIFKALGKIKQLQVINIINQVVYMIILIIFLYNGYGLVGLAISNLIATLLLRFQLVKSVNKIIKSNKIEYKLAKEEFDNNSQVYNIIKKNSTGIGFVLMSNYLQSQGITILSSVFLSLEIVAEYGITMQFIGVISSISALTVKTYLPKISYLQLNSKQNEVEKIFSLTTIISWVTFSVGSLVLLILGQSFLRFIDSGVQLLPTKQVIILLIYTFVLTNHQRSTDIIQLFNSQVYVKAYVVSSIFSLIFCAICMSLGAGIWGLILPNLFIQMLYNGWKWPKEALSLINVSYLEMLRITYKEIFIKVKSIFLNKYV